MEEILLQKYEGYINRGSAWVDAAKKLYLIQLEKAVLQKREAELKELLIDLSEQKNSIGGGFVFTTTERLGAIDYKSIPELKFIDVERYRKGPSFSWSLKKV